MLSLFPTLYAWQEVSPLLIRLVLGAVFIHWAYAGLRASGANGWWKLLAAVEGLAGIFAVVGLWTQLAALFLGVDLLVRIIGRITKKAFLTNGVNYYLILLVLAVSLLVTGAGWLAFDAGF